MFTLGDSRRKADRYKPEEINYRLPDAIRPIHYNIAFTSRLSHDDFTFDGETLIDLDVRESTSDVTLHRDVEIVIDETATILTSSKDERFLPIEHLYVAEKEFLVIRFPVSLKPARYKLRLKFNGVHDEDTHGFNRRTYTSERDNTTWCAVTNFKTTFARRAFPCFDEPAMKATFSISLKHRPDYVALSNMPVEESSSIDQGAYVSTNFQTTPIMSTYSLAIVLLPVNYLRITIPDGTVNVWCRKLINVNKLIHQVTKKATIQLESYTGIRMPISKIDHVLISDHSSRSSENWGLIVYDEEEMMYAEDPSDTYNVEMITRLVTHDLVHQWFGNLVSPSWWNHLWLNEAFAHYFQYYIVDKIYEGWRVLDLFVVAVQQATALSNDAYSFVQRNQGSRGTYREPYAGICAIGCRKGTSLLRMLSHCLTEDVFHAGIVTYLKKFQYNTATPDDLWQIFEEKMHPEKMNLKEMMDTWIKQSGYPLVTAKRDRNTGAIIVTQERFKQPNGDEVADNECDDDDTRWWIPINYTSKSRAIYSFGSTTTHWLKPQDENWTINDVDEDDWFILNLRQIGYYRVNYNTSNWRKLAEYLDSDDYVMIHPLNRAQIIDDACYMVLTKRLNPVVFLEIVKYLRRETDYIPWYPAFRALRTFQDYLKFPDGAIFLKPYVLRLMNGLLKNVGYDERPDDDHLTKLKRAEVLELAGDFGHVECRKVANAKLIAHVNDPNSNPIPSNLNMWIFTSGMREADESLFDKFLDRYKNKPSFQRLRCLCGIEDLTLVKKLLNLTLSENSPILKDDLVEVYRSVMYTSSRNVDITVDFVIDNWNKITTRIEDADEIIDDIVGEITSWDQFDKVKSFMETNGLKGKRNIEDSRMFLKNAEIYIPAIHTWLIAQAFYDEAI